MRSSRRCRSTRWVLAMIPVLAGCNVRTSIPATELPTLARSMEQHPDGLHHVQGIDGRSGTLCLVKTIELIHRSGQSEPVEEPVRASLPHGRSTLLIRHPSGEAREIPLSSVERVDVVYRDPVKRDRAVGITLLLASIPFFVLGSWVVARASAGDCGAFYGAPFCAPQYLLAGVSYAGGLGLSIPGLVIVARDKLVPSMPSTSDQHARQLALREQKPDDLALREQKAAEAEENERARYWKAWAEAHPADPCSSALASLKGASECVGAACEAPLVLMRAYQKSCHPDPETRIAVHRLRRRWEKESTGDARR